MQWWIVGEEAVVCVYIRAEIGSGAQRSGVQSAA
jgi:hypothetical protein